MEKHPFDCGLLVGRFQTFHIGHEMLVRTGLTLCDRMVIMVGSAQESGTERNPYNVATRMKMIREVFPDESRVIIRALPDLTNEDDIRPEWGTFLLSKVDEVIYKAPECMIYGNDESRSKWFNTNEIKNTSEFIINRAAIDISATKVRRLMVENNRREWMKWVNPRLHKMYDELRGQLMEVPFYKAMEQEAWRNEND